MRISGFDDPDSSGWDALHRGTEREGFDSPSKFDMSTLSMIMPKRKPSRPKPDAQGYTDEDTREWGPSADDEEHEAPEPVDYAGRRSAARGHAADDHARPEPGVLPGRRPPEYARPESGDRPAFGGYRGRRSREFGDEPGRAESGAFPVHRSREFGDESGAYPVDRSREFGDEPGRPDSGAYPVHRPREFGDESGAYPVHRSPEPADHPDPFGYQGPHSPVVDEDGYDPVEPEWQDEESYEPEPPPLEPAWTPPRGARPPAPPRPPAPRPPVPRPPAPRPPAPVSRPPAPVARQAAPPPAWAPPPADWTPPPDPETRWIPQPEPWEDPAWNEPARVASPVPVASPGSRVRPYTRTGGRTRSDHNLALEALVSTSDDGRRYRGVRSVEHRRICDLCLDTRSVAEIAAHLRLPLGVVKVLVGDMADIGLVLIHQTELILGDRSSREFMERVLAGLRAL
ncbi:DUF742 domain-containing protein [Amycolatopsis rifamycinica]|uniref:Multi-component regulatory system-8 n=1 Tax=Amycolatopsis rifamycinica TaxID=287986 RepID=A0A066UH36_9PSEU|nr:hypothetical protein DV20_03395 [Amycolatopsis rifamycinica]